MILRTLVARAQDRIYPSICNDLKDWTEETRLKAAQLMYLVLWHAETDMVGGQVCQPFFTQVCR